MRLVFLGPPGAGKGTQAAMVSEKLGVPQISTGDILRDAVRHGAALGLEAKAYMERGDLVPDGLMLDLVRERLAADDCRRGYVLDGYPRTFAQAEALDEMLAGEGTQIDAVVLIEVNDDEVVRRLSQRRVCPMCKALYNLEAGPPRVEGICDQCGTAVITRTDDSETTIRTRLEVYRSETLPLVKYYEKKGVLKRVVSAGGIDKVASSIMGVLAGAEKG
jgi:adenylate kinase